MSELPHQEKRAIKALLARPVAFHPALAKLTGSVKAGLMLSQALYWTDVAEKTGKGGWFYKSAEEWTDEICLSRPEQAAARATLKDLKLLEDERRGMPATLHFRVNVERVIEALEQAGEGQFVKKFESRLQNSCNQDLQFSRNCKTAKQVARKSGNKIPEKRATSVPESAKPLLIAETSSETTQETTSASGRDRELDLVATALAKYATPDDAAVRFLIDECRKVAPDATAQEIAAFVYRKGPVALGKNVENPLGLLLRAVPPCFEGASFAMFRRQRAEEQREAEAQAAKDSEDASFRLAYARKIRDDPTNPHQQWAREYVQWVESKQVTA